MSLRSFVKHLIPIIFGFSDFIILFIDLLEIDFKFKTFDLRVTEEDFSNFNIIDNELIQPSFDPSNKLMGAYISRNKNIYQIFADKFNELFNKGTPINQFIKQKNDLNINSLSDFQMFILCLL